MIASGIVHGGSTDPQAVCVREAEDRRHSPPRRKKAGTDPLAMQLEVFRLLGPQPENEAGGWAFELYPSPPSRTSIAAESEVARVRWTIW